MSYKQMVIRGPFKGIWDATPRPNTPNESFDDAVNFLMRKGRIQSRPRLNAFANPADGNPFYNIVTFADVTGALHTLGLTKSNAYMLGAGPAWSALSFPASITTLGDVARPFGVGALNNRIYFSNGSALVMYSDGTGAIMVASADGLVGGANVVQGGARYMAVNNFHLILAFMTESSTDYPARVRWSKSGDPNDWTDLTAGMTDLAEVVDYITGLATIGRNTYIWRTNGISAMAPTGIGVAPFSFEQVSYSVKGIGNRWPYGLAVYGNRACWPGHDDIYAFDGSITPIGGNCKKKIFEDLKNATDINSVYGFQVDKLGPGFDYNSYWLSIAGPNVTWVYHFDEANWVRFYSSAGALTCIGTAAVA